jgi:hypothetical protein
MVTPISLVERIRSIENIDNNPLLKTDLANSDDILCRVWFKNYRRGRGLRLSKQGLMIFQQLYRYYIFNLGDEFKIKSQHLIFLDRVSEMPWYLDPKCIIIFDKKFAFRFKLIGNLDQFMSAYTDLKTKFVTDYNKK